MRKKVFEWQFVKNIAELKIITKVSYTMLVIIPLLAAIWPSFILINDNAKIELIDKIESVRCLYDRILNDISVVNMKIFEKDKLSQSNGNHGTNYFKSDAFEQSIININEIISKLNEIHFRLPWTLAAGFFSALIVVVAHFFYQIFAPDIVKKHTLDSYVEKEKESFKNNPSYERIRICQKFLEGKSGLEYDPQFAEILKSINQLKALKTTVREQELNKLTLIELDGIFLHLKYLHQSNMISVEEGVLFIEVENLIDFKKREEKGGYLLKYELSIIEKHAIAKYLFYSQKRHLGIYLILLMYLSSIYIIFSIVFTQSLAIKKSAGWESFREIFTHIFLYF
jgi:hypothetical protein